jgi:hypothetical protein
MVGDAWGITDDHRLVVNGSSYTLSWCIHEILSFFKWQLILLGVLDYRSCEGMFRETF